MSVEDRLAQFEQRLSKVAEDHISMKKEFKECKRALKVIYEFHAKKLKKHV